MSARQSASGLSAEERTFLLQLYEKYKPLMVVTVRRYISNPNDQEDVLQDSLFRLVKNVETIQKISRYTLPTYIVCTIKSAAYDFLRKEHRRADRLIHIDAGEIENLPEYKPLLNDFQENTERKDVLRKIWSKLSEDEQVLLESKYILGYSDADLAVTLKCKPSSIRMKLFRAREKARKLIRSLGRDVEL